MRTHTPAYRTTCRASPEVPGEWAEAREIFIGIDGGGTYTRAVAVAPDGAIIARATTAGSSPEHRPAAEAQANASMAIRQVVENADCKLSGVAGLVAGILGVNEEENKAAAGSYVSPDGLTCPRLVVNDAVVAHAGALLSRPGIIAIGGTGSIVFGVNEAGSHIRNYDFRHWSAANAASIAYHAMHRLLAGDAGPADHAFAARVQEYWEVRSLAELRRIGARGFIGDGTERNRRFGEMAQLVTEAAMSGAPLAVSVCDQAAAALFVGIRLVATCFEKATVEVALIGGVATSDYLQGAVARLLNVDSERAYRRVNPAYPPEIGAAMMALEGHGIAVDSSVLARLSGGI